MLRSITIITCVGVIGIVLLQLFDRHDGSIQAISIIIGFLTPTIVGLLSLMKSQENSMAIQDMHKSTDNTLSQISSNAQAAAVKAEAAANKADESAAKIELAVQNGNTVIEQTHKIAEAVSQTAQNVEAIKKNGH